MSLQTLSPLRQNLAVRLLSLLVALAVALAAFPQPALAATAGTCDTKYTVQAGDTLTSIAAAYKINVQDLIAANDLKEPYTIYVNQVLCIPGVASTTPGTTTPKGPTFTATLDGDFARLTISGFPSKTTFLVRAASGDRRLGPWVKLGRVPTGKTGAAKVSIKLPKGMRDNAAITLCLKNVYTDKLTCTIARR
jgi:hypothetical protein